jgi:hypothetical protein
MVSTTGALLVCVEISRHEEEARYVFHDPWSEAVDRFLFHSWSPDGGQLAGADVFPVGGVVIYTLESQKYKRLTDFGGYPAWLPDSRRLLFTHRGSIHLVDSDSGRVREVLSVPPDRIETVSISQDNRWIYFNRLVDEADIWMLTLNEEQEQPARPSVRRNHRFWGLCLSENRLTSLRTIIQGEELSRSVQCGPVGRFQSLCCPL